MKKTHILFVTVLLMALGFSCTDVSKYPVNFDTLNNSNAGILRIISQNSVILTSDIAVSKYEVTFEANDRERGNLFDHADLFVSFKDLTPSNGGTNRAEAKLATYTNADFKLADPDITGLRRVTMTHTATEIMTLLGITLPEIVNGKDQFVFRQALVFPDGKTYSSGNVNSAIASTGGVYKSPFQNIVTVVVCASALDGDLNFHTVVTGAVVSIVPCQPFVEGKTTLKKITHGEYAIGDATFGQYECAWSDVDAFGVNWVDFCDAITTTGSDKYGLIYTYSLVTNDGTTLVLDWFNDYGDTGTTSLTRVSGATWPLTLSFP